MSNDAPNGSNKWRTIRWLMRGAAAGLMPVIASTPPGWLSIALTGIGAALGFWSLDFPKDKHAWSGVDRRKPRD